MQMGDWNPWKVAFIGIAVVITTAVVTELVVGDWTSTGTESSMNRPAQKMATRPGAAVSKGPVARSTVPAPSPTARASTAPPASDVEACNQNARSVAAGSTGDTTRDVLTKAVIGGAIGAGVGATGGAIAGGGGGAGKGAAIGGIVGATAGTLYGLNDANQQDARAVEAYRSCMRGRGHTG
jgi:hypothetical protein